MEQYAVGNPDAARILVDRHATRLHRYASYVLGSAADADDVVQETMIRLWKKAPGWKTGDGGISAWTRKVCTNLCMDIIRKRKKEFPVPDDLPATIAPAHEIIEEVERVDELYRAIAMLSPRQRMAVVLRHIDGQSNQQVADIMGCGLRAAESMIARGMRNLRDRLSPRREELGLGK